MEMMELVIMEMKILIFIMVMLVVCQSVGSELLTLQRTTKNNGLHREVTTKVIFAAEFFNDLQDPTKCKCLLLEMLPSTVYVDPYQLNQLLHFGGPEVICPEVDIEKPEYLSPPINISIFTSKLEARDHHWVTSITLPVHLRYHRPVSDPSQDFQQILIPNPLLYINCSNKAVMIGEEFEMACDNTNTSLCVWKKIQYHLDTDAVSFNVPVGKQTHLLLVLCSTLMVTIGGCICIIKAIKQKDKKCKVS